MNIETIKYISKIAGFAADQLKSGKTLKASKAWLAAAMREESTPYVHHDGVNFADVDARPTLHNALEIKTKDGFIRQCEHMVKVMRECYENAVMAGRVEHTITIAKRDHGVELHAADVIEWANGDIYFNFTKAAKELSAAAGVQVEVTGETVRVGQTIEDEKGRAFVVDQVMKMAGYTDARGYAVGSTGDLSDMRSIRFDTCNANRMEYGVPSTRLVKELDCSPEAIEAYHAEALEADARTEAHWISNASPENFHIWTGKSRREVLDRVHGLALAMNAQVDAQAAVLNAQREAIRSGAWVSEAPAAVAPVDKAFAAFWNNSKIEHVGEALRQWSAMRTEAVALDAERSKANELQEAAPRKTYRKRSTSVKLVSPANVARTFRISLDNGRVYLYTEGAEFAQIKMPGGRYNETSSAYTLQRLRDAIREWQAE
ncbi:hypothetical protein [Enterobacter bugandensis]|uniref:hypothetical protein n=1 Tax=Enterobacter bugandensis TaxID=881260 RepID=UPI0020059FC8|nr:hypothetical protein [Enterobacter bugandensis]MCK7435911.1 hypothetical protein [Enterobacter bugandensis]